MVNKMIKKILWYAIGLGVAHHLFHLWIQPMLNRQLFFQNLPPIFLGSTFGVTIFITTIAFLGTWYVFIKK